MFIFLFVDSFVWAVLPQAELLSKKYAEKYMQVGDVASKLTIEEATFRDIQVTVMFGFPLLYVNVLAIIYDSHSFQTSDDTLSIILYVGEKNGTLSSNW